MAVSPGLWELTQGTESRMDVGSACCFNHCLLCRNDNWDQSGSESWVKCEQPSLEWQDFDIEAVRSE